MAKKTGPRAPLPKIPCRHCKKIIQPTRSWQAFCPGGKCKEGNRRKKSDPDAYEKLMFEYRNAIEIWKMKILKIARTKIEEILKGKETP